MGRSSGTAAILGLLAICRAQGAADVDAILRTRVDNGLATGMSVALIAGDDVTFHNCGVLAVDDRRPVSENTVYEIGSVTKVFTALALADMAARGALGLDDPLDKLWPQGSSPPERQGDHITLRQLAQHTSGLPRMPGNFAPRDWRNPYADYSADRLFTFLSDCRLGRKPGAAYEYSNLGFGLLGELLARRAGTTFDELVRSRVCRPLGMRETQCVPPAVLAARMAKGHHGARLMPHWDFAALAGCGALRSTSAELAHFVQAHLHPEHTPLDAAIRLLLDRTHEASMAADGRTVTLGWHVTARQDRVTYWHNGGTGGYRSYVGFDPDRGTGVVVLSNSCYSVDDIGRHLLDPTVSLEAIRPTVRIDPAVLQRYTGRYTLTPMVAFEVTMQHGQLFVQLTGQNALPIWPASADRFFYRDVEAELTFVAGEIGPASQLILHQGGRDQPAMRLPQ